MLAGESAMPVIEASPTTEDDILLSVQQVAERWQLDPATLANLRARGEGLPFIKLPSGGIRYKAADVLAAEAAGVHGFSWKRVANALEAHPRLSADQALEMLTYLRKALRD